MGYLRSLLGFEGVAPRVEQIVLSSLLAAISAFYAIATLVGLATFERLLHADFGNAIKSAIDNPTIFTPSLILLVAGVIGLALSLGVIHRARRRGAMVVSTNGILHHYNQINISMRVETFQALLSPTAKLVSEIQLDEAFHEGGLKAGKAFGVAFPSTYHERIQRGGMPDWDAVTFDQRLAHWRRNDETSGWGDIQINRRPAENRIVVQIYHPTLFRGTIGNAWAHFMSGYIEAFLNEISLPRGQIRFDRDTGIENHGLLVSFEFYR